MNKNNHNALSELKNIKINHQSGIYNNDIILTITSINTEFEAKIVGDGF